MYCMNRISYIVVALVMFMPAMGQNPLPTPLEVVQAQLDAYNRQDVKAFAAQFAPEIKIYNRLGDSIPSLQGRQAVEKRYKELFDQYPKNYSTLTGRMVEGNYVIDHEVITGRERIARIMAVYEVLNGLITRCWFIRP